MFRLQVQIAVHCGKLPAQGLRQELSLKQKPHQGSVLSLTYNYSPEITFLFIVISGNNCPIFIITIIMESYKVIFMHVYNVFLTYPTQTPMLFPFLTSKMTLLFMANVFNVCINPIFFIHSFVVRYLEECISS